MDEPVTLLAHLVPRLTTRVEDAATDALSFILNGSEACRRALDHVLQDGEFAPEPIARVETQVTYDDGSRPDMLGYDRDGTKRLVVEAKFWAAIQPSQPKGYIDHLDAPGPGVLLFIAPASLDGYGCYFAFADTDGYAYLCVNFVLWTLRGDTPLWLLISDRVSIKREKLRDRRPAPMDIRGLTYLSKSSDYNTSVPVYLKTGVEYDEVVADAVEQIAEIAGMTDKASDRPEESMVDTTET